MKILNKKTEMVATTKAWQGAGETVCLVPTMGNIHRGHLALIEMARKTAARVVVSIYVNPTQFGADEDFDNYPRTLDADCVAIAAEGGCDVIYVPKGIYASAHATNIIPSGVALPMEGEARPHFFVGVATVVSKLFNHIPADFAIFGEKDFQQLAVLRQMVDDLDLTISLIGHPIVRESDGLALSSRNHYLSTEQRAIAPLLYQTLGKSAAEILAGVDVLQSLNKAKNRLLTGGFTKIDYLDLRDAVYLAASKDARADDRLLVAAWLGETRLIDNCAIGSHADTI